MEGFRVFDSVQKAWFWWDGEEYSHWWDSEKKQWVEFQKDAEKHQNAPPEQLP